MNTCFNEYPIRQSIMGPEEENCLRKIIEEVHWDSTVTHKSGRLPRKFATQAAISSDNVFPLYRHPVDELPAIQEFTPHVNKIRHKLQICLQTDFNHVIIQEYKDGRDFIGRHSDKTIDIAKDSLIVNYSIGASRIMRLRHKETKKSQDICLANDSAFVLNLDMNQKYTHEIIQDQNIQEPRISLTFRNIATFYDPKSDTISGQGAPKNGIKGLTREELFHAWHLENKRFDYDWEQLYSKGFSVLSLNQKYQ